MKKFIILGILVGIFFAITIHLTGGITSSNFIRQPFRQSDNANKIYWSAKEGKAFSSINPMFGPPWTLPLEFPFYHGICAALVKWKALNFEATCRLVNLFFFLLGAPFFYYFLLRSKLCSKSCAFFCTGAYLLSPYNLFWARSIMMDYMAVTFGLIHLFFHAEYLNSKNKLWPILSIISLSICILIKPTIYAAILPLALAIYLCSSISEATKLRNEPIGKTGLYHATFFAIGSIIIPCVVFLLWKKHSDEIKLISQGTSWYVLTFKRSFLWYVGWDKLLNFSRLSHWGSYIFLVVQPVIFICFCFILLRSAPAGLTTQKQFPRSLVLLAAADILMISFFFFNVHSIHSYYMMGLAPAIAILCGCATHYLWRKYRASLSVGSWAVALAGLLTFCFMFNYWFLILRWDDNAEKYQQLKAAGELVQKYCSDDSCVVIDLADNGFDPAYAYACKRRVLFLPASQPVIDKDPELLKCSKILITNKENPKSLKLWQEKTLLCRTIPFDIYYVCTN